MLTLRHISKSYPTGKSSLIALRDISLDINPGDFIVIRGPSGSGKSTLLNILGLLDTPSGGEVCLFDQKITYEDFDQLATLRSLWISFIFQSFNLNPILTLEENVMVPLMIRKDIPKKEKQHRVASWVDKVGLTSHKSHKPDELSGGQRQRAAIARAMVTEPKLVIADEPTANLDSSTSKNILGLMKDLNSDKATAFVFATHDPVLNDYANTHYRIQDGRLESATIGV